MRVLRALLVTVTLTAGTALTAGVTAGPAAAHTHPTPIELDSPAAVRVQTYGQVSISLIEHTGSGAHIGLLQRTYTPLLASGSGFAVDPSGTIVTSPGVIDVDLERAEIFAVNKIFHERYGDWAPLPSDPFSRHTVPDVDPDERVSGRLQRCYQPNKTDDTGGCVVFSTRVVKVLPFVSSQKQYGDLPAEVLVPRAGKTADVAVLKVGASSMPTVDLATSTKDVTAFSMLGFSATPTNARSLRLAEGHFTGSGTTRVKDEDYETVVAGLRAGMRGGPVVGERGQVIGFLDQRSEEWQGSAAADLALVGPKEIRAALSAADIDPQRGPTDAVYENAMHNYKNKLYAASVPSLAQVLKLYPGHALAADALAVANRKKGTAEDATGQGSTAQDQTAQPAAERDFQRFVVPLSVGAVTIVLLVLLVLFLLRRGRRRSATSPGGRTDRGPAVAPAHVPQQPPPADQPRAEARRAQETVVRSRAPFDPTPAGPTSTPPTRPVSGFEATRQVPSGDGRLDPSDPSDPSRLSDPSTCAACGERVSPAQEFCGHCGRRLR